MWKNLLYCFHQKKKKSWFAFSNLLRFCFEFQRKHISISNSSKEKKRKKSQMVVDFHFCWLCVFWMTVWQLKTKNFFWKKLIAALFQVFISFLFLYLFQFWNNLFHYIHLKESISNYNFLFSDFFISKNSYERLFFIIEYFFWLLLFLFEFLFFSWKTSFFNFHLLFGEYFHFSIVLHLRERERIWFRELLLISFL